MKRSNSSTYRRSTWLLLLLCALTDSACQMPKAADANGPEQGSGANAGSSAGSPSATSSSAAALSDTQTPTTFAVPAGTANMWLHTHARDMSKAKDPVPVGFYRQNGTQWLGRGIVIHDTRNCDSCVWRTGPNPTETLRRIDIAVDQYHANYLRLVIESYNAPDQGTTGGATRVSWNSLLYDEAYLQGIKTIVDYIGTKKNVYVQISMWRDSSLDGSLYPTFDSQNAPGTLCDTPAFAGKPTTSCTWKKLATTFRDYPYVMFNVDAEPAGNSDGARDADIWGRLNALVQVIRNVEDAAGTPHHIITVPGTRMWARSLEYFARTDSSGKAVMHPITVSGGDNIAYQSHPYLRAPQFFGAFVDTAQYLPVVLGEFGPIPTYMDYADVTSAINIAENNKIPYTAWTMHPNCGPASTFTQADGNAIHQCDGLHTASIVPNTWGNFFFKNLQANLLDEPTVTLSNLARGKAAEQSSVYLNAAANRATDGNPSTLWSSNSVTHTQNAPGSTDPYWQIDLGDAYTLTQLQLMSRSDCCSERLQGALLFVSTKPFSSARVAVLAADASVTSIRLGRYLNGAQASVNLQNIKGRYLRIAVPGDNQILSLGEVQIMGI